MKKENQKDSLAGKLKSYSLLASSVIAFGSVQAQIQYTDIDPDSTINTNGLMEINMDKAGNAEFNIENVYTNYSSSGNVYMYHLLKINPYSNNEFLGIESVLQIYTYTTSLIVPTVMEQDDKIGPNESYWTDSSGFLYGKGYSNNQIIKVGKWLNQEDKYVGVRMKFEGDVEYHYGWIRLSVPNDSTIIVKDFAYESHPGKAIMAGATYSSVEESENAFKIFTSSKNLVIINDEAEAIAMVYTITGQLVANKDLNRGQNKIDLNELAQGYYIVKIHYQDAVFTDKILLK